MTEKENLKRVFTHGQTPAWIPHMFTCYNFIVPTDAVADRPPFGTVEGTDWFGVHWKWDETGNGFGPDLRYEPPCSDITKWKEQIKFPDLEAIDWEKCAKPVREAYDDTKMTQVMLQSGLFERIHALIGFEEALVSMLTEPEAFLELMEAVTQHRIAVVEKVAEYYRPDVITNMDDYGTQRGLLMSNELFRTFIQPFGKRLVDAVKKTGAIYMHHSCGKIDKLLPDMMEMGIQALTAVSPQNDVDWIIENYQNKLIFDGGMDTNGVLEQPGILEAEKRAHVRWALDKFGPTGCYVAGGYTQHQEVEALVIDEVLKYGSSFYNKE